jgi:Outer membrane protein beta-barrel domain
MSFYKLSRPLAAAALVAICTAAPAQDAPQPSLLLTRPGWEIGGQVSKYKYEEPGLMNLKGERLGFVGAYTATNDVRVYSRIDLRVSYGKLDYKSVDTGESSDIPDWIGEVRAVVGRDYLVGEGLALSPYLGLGYRYLYNDLRGYSSNGAKGYRRYSEYFYAPIGLTMRIRAGSQWVVAPTVEYDAFIGGKQKTKLSDAGVIEAGGIVGIFPTINNKQERGRGYRVSLMFEKDRWALGPWFHYWNIKDSDHVFIGVNPSGQSVFLHEPPNRTREGGFEFRYRF